MPTAGGRTRHLKETLAALEQAQESFFAARMAEDDGASAETADIALEQTQATFYTARFAAEINRMSNESSTPAEAADAMTDAAMYALASCIREMLEADTEPDPTKPHNATWIQQQRLDVMEIAAAATAEQPNLSAMTDAERTERTTNLLECLKALNRTNSAMADARDAARRAGPDADAAIARTSESIATSIEAVSLLLRGF